MTVQYIRVDDKKLALVDIKGSTDLLDYLENLEDSLEALQRVSAKQKTYTHNQMKREFLENRILKMRLTLGITQEQLAMCLKVSQAYVSKVENPSYRPSLATLRKFAKALKVSVEDLA